MLQKPLSITLKTTITGTTDIDGTGAVTIKSGLQTLQVQPQLNLMPQPSKDLQ